MKKKGQGFDKQEPRTTLELPTSDPGVICNTIQDSSHHAIHLQAPVS